MEGLLCQLRVIAAGVCVCGVFGKRGACVAHNRGALTSGHWPPLGWGHWGTGTTILDYAQHIRP